MQATFSLKFFLFISTFLISNIFVESGVVTFQNENNELECSDNINDSPVCTTPGCIHAASVVLQNIDPSVEPCDDFYKFACGGFVKRYTIPEDKSVVISFNLINDKVEEQLKTILEEPVRQDEPKPFLQLKQLYEVCLNTAAIEADGLNTAKKLLRELGGWPLLEGDSWKKSEFDWIKTMYKFREIGLPAYNFLSMYVGVDIKNTSRRMMNLDQGLLSLDRDYLTEGLKNEMVKAYYDYLVDVAVIFGAQRSIAEAELKSVMEFEIQLAKITVPKEERRNLSSLYNPMTVQQLKEKYPSIPWLEYITKLISVPHIQVTADEVVDVGVPKYISDLEVLLSKTDKRIQANYVFSSIVSNLVSLLTKELRDRELKYKEITDGTREMRSRWKECVDTATSGMKIASGALYVRNYFNEDAKRNAKTLVSDLQSTFIDLLKQIDWMDETTRKHALEKAHAMASHIAYPPELLDDKKITKYYEDLESSNNYLEYALRIRKFMDNNSYRKLREIVNKTDWTKHSGATKVNAYYNNQENSIQLPAGILQGAFFDNDRPHYMNYGAMGYVIGHEITHGFDDIGRQHNKNGELEEWWAEDTKQAFMKKAQCIIDQYSSYVVPEVNLTLNGINTQGENIADNGGIKEAYLAYNAWIERNGEEKGLPGLPYTPKQMFWISSANLWCSKQRKEYLKQHIHTDVHSPSYFRVLGSFSNSEYFSRDFNCPLGSKMNPEHKCHVW